MLRLQQTGPTAKWSGRLQCCLCCEYFPSGIVQATAGYRHDRITGELTTQVSYTVGDRQLQTILAIQNSVVVKQIIRRNQQTAFAAELSTAIIKVTGDIQFKDAGTTVKQIATAVIQSTQIQHQVGIFTNIKAVLVVECTLQIERGIR